MLNDDEVAAARQLLGASKHLAGSESVVARRCGERVSAIVADLLYEHDPWAGLPGSGPALEHAYLKPLPIVTEENAGHWNAARNGELRLQRCSACGMVRFPIAPVCPQCLSNEFVWSRLSGRGSVGSWVVFHKAYWPAFKPDLPYIVAQIELEEGPRYTSNLVGVRSGEVSIGMPVEVVFDAVTDEITLPKFRRRPSRG